MIKLCEMFLNDDKILRNVKFDRSIIYYIFANTT